MAARVVIRGRRCVHGWGSTGRGCAARDVRSFASCCRLCRRPRRYRVAHEPRTVVRPTADANGIFLFDILLPPTYPAVAPSVKFLTTGGGQVRFNPNLYAGARRGQLGEIGLGRAHACTDPWLPPPRCRSP